MKQTTGTTGTGDCQVRLRWVGQAVPRREGLEQVSGAFRYPSDLSLPGLLHACPVLAGVPRARVRAVETTPALTVPGVVAVITAADVRGQLKFGIRQDRPALCDGEVRYCGEVVAVVASETRRAAEEGARRVRVQLEALPPVLDPVEARERGQICHQIHHRQGDVEAGFSASAVIVEETYRVGFMDHAFLETEAALAVPTADGGVTVYAGGQNVFYDRDQVALVLGLPREKVRMVESHTGGAFGGKGDITVQIMAALVAMKTGRPCRMVLSREEHFLNGVKRHPAIIHLMTGASADGVLLAHRAEIVADTGPYTVYGDGVLELMAENITGPYRFPNTDLHAWSVYTNNLLSGAFRGFGAAQSCFALENQMSRLAERLGMDEIDFRLRNLLAAGDISGWGHRLTLSVGLRQALEQARCHPLWVEGRRSHLTRRGVGVACSMKGYGLGTNGAPDWAAATISRLPDGRFRLALGIIELGQGSLTALAQIAAEELGVDPDQIEVVAADTAVTPESGTTASSRVTYAVGRVVMQAARALRQRMADPEAAELTVTCREQVPFASLPAAGGLGHPHVLYSGHVQLVEVGVDGETGEVQVRRVVSWPEAGRVINRLGLEGQCEGGTAMGVGYALLEKVVLDGGCPQNPDLATYTVPTSLDVPLIEVHPVEVPEETGPWGAKGVGENATLPTAPAIVDAIARATGVRLNHLPVAPEELLQAMAPEARLRWEKGGNGTCR